MALSHVREEAGVAGVESVVGCASEVEVGSEVSVGGTVGVCVGAGVGVCGTKTSTVGACRSVVVRAVFSAFTKPYTPPSIKSANTAATGKYALWRLLIVAASTGRSAIPDLMSASSSGCSCSISVSLILPVHIDLLKRLI